MPRSTDLSTYGPEYEQLLLRASAALANSSEFAVQFESGNIATSIRTRTYGYFKALRSSNTRPDLTAISSNISMRVAGSALVFFKREDAVDAIAIRRALSLPDGFASTGANEGLMVPESSLSSHLDKLNSIRERKNTQK